MGASIALAGFAACRRPVQKILPYSQQPEDIVPGIPLFYASAMPFHGNLVGLVVENHEGRPTKIEGNDLHPGESREHQRLPSGNHVGNVRYRPLTLTAT